MTAPGDPPPPTAPRGPFRWCFEHRDTGRIAIAQWPNLPAWITIAALLVQVLAHPAGRFGLAVTIVFALALTWWALDEIVRGANPWRRALGVAALAYEAWRFWPW